MGPSSCRGRSQAAGSTAGAEGQLSCLQFRPTTARLSFGLTGVPEMQRSEMLAIERLWIRSRDTKPVIEDHRACTAACRQLVDAHTTYKPDHFASRHTAPPCTATWPLMIGIPCTNREAPASSYLACPNRGRGALLACPTTPHTTQILNCLPAHATHADGFLRSRVTHVDHPTCEAMAARVSAPLPAPTLAAHSSAMVCTTDPANVRGKSAASSSRAAFPYVTQVPTAQLGIPAV